VQKQGAETGCRNKVQKQGAGPHRQQRRKYAMQIMFMPDSRKENMAFGFVYSELQNRFRLVAPTKILSTDHVGHFWLTLKTGF
jgi:hypothetical protein